MMKWWGWGAQDWTFPMKEKPKLWPWMMNILGLESDTPTTLPVSREDIKLPEPQLNEEFLTKLSQALATHQICIDEEERLLHSYGKSFPDLFHVRRGHIRQAPDAVLLPEKHSDVVHIVRLANEHNVCVIPFGGGTNIVGGVDPLDSTPQRRMIVSVDMRRMNRLLSIDKKSRIAVIEAGALGPKLEADLEKEGWSLGHHPDSFEFSTIGGWIATRSAGMQSDAYGKIEDMVVALKMVTPEGTIQTKTVPAKSSGIELNNLIIGSEGILGIITEATMKVHPIPDVKDYRGFLFKSFEDGIAAVYECVRNDCLPSMIRLQDRGETQLALQLKSPKTGWAGLIEKPVKAWLASNGYDQPCIMVVGFEGTKSNVDFKRRKVQAILKKHDAFSLGTSVGKTWSKDKYNVPYLRDVVMDFGVMVDVAETSAVWTNLLPLYHASIAALKEKFAQDNIPTYYLGCHLSHTYEAGACLYFTYAAKLKPGNEMKQYYSYKYHFTETFVRNGGTLSHHHAVGYEHAPWMAEEVSATGIKALKGIKKTLDPKQLFNPGKLIPSDNFTPDAKREDVIEEMVSVLTPHPEKKPEKRIEPTKGLRPEADSPT